MKQQQFLQVREPRLQSVYTTAERSKAHTEFFKDDGVSCTVCGRPWRAHRSHAALPAADERAWPGSQSEDSKRMFPQPGTASARTARTATDFRNTTTVVLLTGRKSNASSKPLGEIKQAVGAGQTE